MSFVSGERHGNGTDVLADLQRRRGLAFKTQEVQVFLNTGANGSSVVELKLLLKKVDCGTKFALRGSCLCLNLNRGTERSGKMRFSVECRESLLQLIKHELLSFDGVVVGSIELSNAQSAACQP